MIEGYSPLAQAFLGTLFTWGMTAFGASAVFFFNGYERRFLDGSLGFAAGVMTAATVWSLLLPAIEISEQMNGDVNNSKFMALVPVLIGIFLGAGFVHLADIFLPDDLIQGIMSVDKQKESSDDNNTIKDFPTNYKEEEGEKREASEVIEIEGGLRQRHASSNSLSTIKVVKSSPQSSNHYRSVSHISRDLTEKNQQQRPGPPKMSSKQFRKIMLLIVAVTVHNVPEGLAVGVGFGAQGTTKSATFQNARNLALGIGIQNFPEGLSISLPLYAAGFSYWRSFWYGQLSGIFEIFAGVLGALAVGIAQSLLAYALSFAAGAMIYVVFENIIPEASAHGNTKLATWCVIVGFCLMMSLDVGLN